MTLMDICKAYGEMHDMGTKEVFDLYLDGAISQWELMDGYLENEGIIGYTTRIISAMRKTSGQAQNMPGRFFMS